MKKNIFTKIIACSMALAMMTATGMTVSAVDTGNTDISTNASDELDALESMFDYSENQKNDGTLNITKYKGSAENVVVPNKIGDKAVTVIAQNAFENTPVKTVTISEGITAIGGFAFKNCKNLTEINMPKSMTFIGSCVFIGCDSLTSVYIPENVSSLFGTAFLQCKNLTDIKADENNPHYTSKDGVLFNKDMTELVAYPCGKKGAYSIPKGVVRISDSAFLDCTYLTGISFPDSLKHICYDSFGRCNGLTEVTFGAGLTNLDRFVFFSCRNLKKAVIPSSATIDANAFHDCDNLTIYGEKNSTAEYFAQKNNLPFETALFNKSTVSAEHIVLGQAVTVKAAASESSCTYAVLYKKTSEKKWTVKQDYSENTVVSIKPAKATDYEICVKVKDSDGNILKRFFDLKVEPQPIPPEEPDPSTEYQRRLDMLSGEFRNHEFLQNDDYYYNINSDGTVSLYFYKGNEQNVTIPSEIDGKTVTNINWPTFNFYSGLKSVVIPDTVTFVGSCFMNCTGLEEISIPKNVTYIYDGTFSNCTSLKNIYVDSENPNYSSLDGVLTNKEQTELIAFPGGREGSYTIPENIESLNIFAFDGCKNLTEITLSDKIKGISSYAFRNCTNLKKVNSTDNLTAIGWYSFENCISLNQIYIPRTVSTMFETTFSGCYNLTIYGEKDSRAETYAQNFNIPFVCVFTNTSTILSRNPITLGDTVMVNASATAGTGDYTYAVYYKKTSEKKWTVKQDYSTNTIVTIKPSKATDYQICVKAKDSSGKVMKKYFDLLVVSRLSNTSEISADSITRGDKITAKCSAAGGHGTYQYAVYCKKTSESKWTVKQNFSTNSEVPIRPSTVTDYDICIKARDGLGNISKKYFTLHVLAKPENPNTSAISTSTIKLGESITINCSCTIPDCKYSVLYQLANGSAGRPWTVLQGYSKNTAVTFTPDQKEIYHICVKAKDSEGNIYKKYFLMGVQ